MDSNGHCLLRHSPVEECGVVLAVPGFAHNRYFDSTPTVVRAFGCRMQQYDFDDNFRGRKGWISTNCP